MYFRKYIRGVAVIFLKWKLVPIHNANVLPLRRNLKKHFYSRHENACQIIFYIEKSVPK